MDDTSSTRFPATPQRRIPSGRLLDWPAGVWYQLNPHGCTDLPKMLNLNRVLLKGLHDWDPEKGTSSCHVFKPIFGVRHEARKENNPGATVQESRSKSIFMGSIPPPPSTDNTKQVTGITLSGGLRVDPCGMIQQEGFHLNRVTVWHLFHMQTIRTLLDFSSRMLRSRCTVRRRSRGRPYWGCTSGEIATSPL